MTVQDVVNTLTQIFTLANKDLDLLQEAILLNRQSPGSVNIQNIQSTLAADFASLRTLAQQLP